MVYVDAVGIEWEVAGGIIADRPDDLHQIASGEMQLTSRGRRIIRTSPQCGVASDASHREDQRIIRGQQGRTGGIVCIDDYLVGAWQEGAGKTERKLIGH